MALTDQTFLQLITRLAHELNDAMSLAATSNGSTTTFVDNVNINSSRESYDGWEWFGTSSPNIEWHVGDADFRLYLDDDPSENDTIPSPQEDYGAGPLKLQATAGGVIYGGLAICSERLTNDQRARLKVVMENRGNIETALDSKRGRYGFFQVRPKVE